MKKILSFIKQKLTLVILVTASTAVGGFTTAAVLAAIPDSNGQINACYNTVSKALSVTDPAGSCGAATTALSWTQNAAGSPVLKDSANHVLGNLIDISEANPQSAKVYNVTLKRVINISQKPASATQDYVLGTVGYAIYATSNCTGQGYFADDIGFTAKTKLLYVNTGSYGIVQDTAQKQNASFSSQLSYDPGSDTFSCLSFAPQSFALYPITAVTLPFSTPLTAPLKY